MVLLLSLYQTFGLHISLGLYFNAELWKVAFRYEEIKIFAQLTINKWKINSMSHFWSFLLLRFPGATHWSSISLRSPHRWLHLWRRVSCHQLDVAVRGQTKKMCLRSLVQADLQGSHLNWTAICKQERETSLPAFKSLRKVSHLKTVKNNKICL